MGCSKAEYHLFFFAHFIVFLRYTDRMAAMNQDERQLYSEGQEEFQSLWFRALLQKMLDTLRGKGNLLCNFENLREDLKFHTQINRGLQEVPLEQIIGTVGRTSDFTRTFLPRRFSMRDRWAGVYTKVVGLEGLPPVKLYRLCEDYFVVDGNHRVSVASRLGGKTIEAEVIEFTSGNCLPVACS